MFILSALGFLKDGLFKILGNWRVMLIIFLGICLGYVAWEFHEKDVALKATETSLQVEKTNNATLTANVATLTQANAADDAIIQQQAADKQQALKSLAELQTKITTTNTSLDNTKKQLAALQSTVKPVKLSPYLSTVIDAIQNEDVAPATPQGAAK